MANETQDSTSTEKSRNEKGSSSLKTKKVIVLHKGEKVYRFGKERIVIGSVVSADVRLTGEGISPIHAVLELQPALESSTTQVATLYDLASDTGVFINAKKIIT